MTKPIWRCWSRIRFQSTSVPFRVAAEFRYDVMEAGDVYRNRAVTIRGHSHFSGSPQLTSTRLIPLNSVVAA